MAMIVENGTGLVDANSYASLEEALAYWTDRGGTAWTGANDSARSVALIKASAYLDGRYSARYIGRYPVDPYQGLLWPRSDAVDGKDYPVTGVPKALKVATFEAAILFLTTDLNAPIARGGAVKKVKVGPVEKEFTDAAPGETEYPAIDNAIQPILIGSGGSGVMQVGRG